MAKHVTRRDFLSFGVVATATILSVPVLFHSVKVKAFNVSGEYSNAVGWYSSDLGGLDVKTKSDFMARVSRHLVSDAESVLPPGTRYERRMCLPSNFGRECGAAWYRHPAMDRERTWDTSILPSPQWQPDLGVYLLGREIA